MLINYLHESLQFGIQILNIMHKYMCVLVAGFPDLKTKPECAEVPPAGRH